MFISHLLKDVLNHLLHASTIFSLFSSHLNQSISVHSDIFEKNKGERVLRILKIVLHQKLFGFVSHELDFADESLVHFAAIFEFLVAFSYFFDLGHFVLDVHLSPVTSRELDEKVSVARLAEEFLLDLLAVFVHGVSNLAKVNRCILKHG